jgi:hypothetical protein
MKQAKNECFFGVFIKMEVKIDYLGPEIIEEAIFARVASRLVGILKFCFAVYETYTFTPCPSGFLHGGFGGPAGAN